MGWSWTPLGSDSLGRQFILGSQKVPTIGAPEQGWGFLQEFLLAGFSDFVIVCAPGFLLGVLGIDVTGAAVGEREQACNLMTSLGPAVSYEKNKHNIFSSPALSN